MDIMCGMVCMCIWFSWINGLNSRIETCSSALSDVVFSIRAVCHLM